jgi:hypothetical protein
VYVAHLQVCPAGIPPRESDAVPHLDLVTLLVRDYGPAIRFFADVLGFQLVDDSPSLTSDARPKRWVVVRPPAR